MDERTEEAVKIFPQRIRELLIREDFGHTREIRARRGEPLRLLMASEERNLGREGILSETEWREMTEVIFGYSMYAHEEELRQGYVTLKGGHRVGFTGETSLEGGKVRAIRNISSYNVRISREILGAADNIMKYAKENLLIVAPPCRGKTTLLRDLLRQLSEIPMENVGIVDERSEIAACYRGQPSNHMGPRTDILDGCPKAEGMLMLLRSMAPTVIGVDELGQREDVEAVLRVVGCGVRIIATVHGDSPKSLQNKAIFAPFFENRIFQYYIFPDGRKMQIYDVDGKKVEETDG